MRLSDSHEFRVNKYAKTLTLAFMDNIISDDVLFTLNSFTGNICPHLEEKDFNSLLNLCNLCISERERVPSNRKIIKNLLECICMFILNFCDTEAEPANERTASFNEALIYLHNNFRNNVSLGFLAKMAHYTPNHFSTVFRKKTNLCFNEYVNELKVKYAKGLISTTDLNFYDIAQKSGFSTYSNFYRAFTKDTGIPPTEYRFSVKHKTAPTGYSWTFRVTGDDLNENNSDIYITTNDLEANTEYRFSYFYSKHSAINFHSIKNEKNAVLIPISFPKDEVLKLKGQTHQISIVFKTTIAGKHKITLKIGNLLNEFPQVAKSVMLSHLVLMKRENSTENGINLAKDYSHSNGNILWNGPDRIYASKVDL